MAESKSLFQFLRRAFGRGLVTPPEPPQMLACEFGCGWDDDPKYVRPGLSIVPACPVHGPDEDRLVALHDHMWGPTLADELRDPALMVRKSSARLVGVARVLHACEWCGEMAYDRLCGTCEQDKANGADGPEEVRL